MFLWVTDFYSLEKIISAFPKIVLLYLKMAGDRNGRVGIGGGGLCSGEARGGEGRLYWRSLNPRSPSQS